MDERNVILNELLKKIPKFDTMEECHTWVNTHKEEAAHFLYVWLSYQKEKANIVPIEELIQSTRDICL